jgi:hypothetical protein
MPEQRFKTLYGRCLCGAVEYRIPDALAYAGYCHCSDCRRFSGSAFSAYGGVQATDFVLTKGYDCITRYAKSEHTVLAFCRSCGSSLYAEKPSRGMIHVRLGTLDEVPTLTPQAHSFVGSKAGWFDVCDDLPQFETSRADGLLIDTKKPPEP